MKGGGFEWRTIGANTKVARGPRRYGIFRKDAPALIKACRRSEPENRYEAPFDYQESIKAAEDITARIRQHEARGRKGEQMPWETKEEYAWRTERGHSWPRSTTHRKAASA